MRFSINVELNYCGQSKSSFRIKIEDVKNRKNRVICHMVIFFPGSSESKIFRGLKIAGIPDIDTFYIARFDSISSRLENQDSNVLRIPTFQNLIFFSFFF